MEGVNISHTMDTVTNPLPLVKLFSLISPTLAIGGFTYSEGLEYAIEIKLINNADQAYQWIYSQIENSLLNTDITLLKATYEALHHQNMDQVYTIDEWVIACRETKELREAERHKGNALKKILFQFDQHPKYQRLNSYLCSLSSLAHLWHIPCTNLLCGYLWSYIENQVSNVVKILPLGQTQGIVLQHKLLNHIDEFLLQSEHKSWHDLGKSCTNFAIISSRHETQYTRIYRS